MIPTLYIAFAFMGGLGFIYFIQRRRLNMIRALIRNSKITSDGKIIIDGDGLEGIIPGVSLETVAFAEKLKIVKRNGKMQDFQPIKILKSCMACGAPRGVCRQITREIVTRVYEGMKTMEIRDLVLERLDSKDPEFVKKWKQFEIKKHTR